MYLALNISSSLSEIFYFSIVAILFVSIILQVILRNKIFIITSLLLIISIIYPILFNNNTLLMIIILITNYTYFIISFIFLTINKLIKNELNNATLLQVKNDTSDFYLSLNSKYKVLSYSNSFANITFLTKKDILKHNGFKLIFDNVVMKKINGKEYTKDNMEDFINHLKVVTSHHRMYEFTLDMIIPQSSCVSNYYGLLQAVYYKKFFIGINVYLYKDKMKLVSELEDKVVGILNDKIFFKNALHAYMSLSEGVALYYDYEENLYYATEAFKRFTKSPKATYTFNEIYSFIDESDIENYNRESELINSINVTRLKYKMKINDELFYCVEDSVYLAKDDKLCSIIHITSNTNVTSSDILSTKETLELLDNLSTVPALSIMNKTKEILSRTNKDE